MPLLLLCAPSLSPRAGGAPSLSPKAGGAPSLSPRAGGAPPRLLGPSKDIDDWKACVGCGLLYLFLAKC